MKKYAIQPLIGVGPIRFGMTRDEVRKNISGEYESFQKSVEEGTSVDAFWDSSFQVFYNKNDKVNFIELSMYKSPNFMVNYDDIDIFKTKADDVVEKIAQKISDDISNKKVFYSYTFPTIELSLWRPLVPDDDEDKNSNDYKKSLYFQTVGIGAKGYYSNVKES